MFIREAIASLLSGDPDLTLVGEADNGRSALQQALEKKPDVLLMDIGMPRLNGLEAARQIRIAPEVALHESEPTAFGEVAHEPSLARLPGAGNYDGRHHA